MMGLFSRIYRESLTSTAVDDYGLTLARLIATPLLSGLAGVGGVVLFSTFVFESITFPTQTYLGLIGQTTLLPLPSLGLHQTSSSEASSNDLKNTFLP